jgi:hypothetical protein
MAEAQSETELAVRQHMDVRHMSLGTVSPDGPQPHVVPMDFVADPNTLDLYLRTRPGTEHARHIDGDPDAGVEGNPNVAGTIAREHRKGDPTEGVYFHGRAERLAARDVPLHIVGLFVDELGAKPGIVARAEADPTDSQFYKIVVSDWFVTLRGIKHHLPWGDNRPA